MIIASLEAICSVKNKSVEGTKVRNNCGVSDWVRPIGAGWLGVVGTKMERATGFEEASESDNGSGSGEALRNHGYTVQVCTLHLISDLSQRHLMFP